MSPADSQKAIKLIKAGSVGIMPTDTIYGIVASIQYPAAIERIYNAKSRQPMKKMIKLVSDIGQLSSLGVLPTSNQVKSLNILWPGPVSVELPSPADEFEFLHFGTKKQAIRMPGPTWLRKIIEKTGPIIATSANISGQPALADIKQIKKQLPDLDFYFEGLTGNKPSRLVALDEAGKIIELKRN